MHRASNIGIDVPEVGRAKSILAGGSSVPTSSPMTSVYSDEAPLSALSITTDQDEALKQAFLAGNDKAFLELYAKYEHSLFYYCKRMMHNEAAAEDAFQEIWTR